MSKSGQFSEFYYYSTTRKVTSSLASMFNQTQVTRYTKDHNTALERFNVELVFGGKEKYFQRKTQDPNLTKPIQNKLPIMCLEFQGLKYDASRKQISNQYVQTVSPTLGSLKQPVGVPYNLSYKVSALVRNVEDGFQILEQILPRFTPDFTLNININPTMGITKDFPVILDNVSYLVQDDGSAEDMRIVIWEFDITVQGWYMGLITDPAIIKTAITNIYADTTITNPLTVMVMDSGGTGDYQDREIVFQGPSQGSATATANVISWDELNLKLYVDSVQGNLSSNVLVVGSNTNATWNVTSIYPSNLPATVITVTPNPPTANADDNYTITTNIQEYLS